MNIYIYIYIYIYDLEVDHITSYQQFSSQLHKQIHRDTCNVFKIH